MRNILISATALTAAVLAAAPAHAAAGDILIRGRAILVAPNEKSGLITPGVGATASRVSINNSVMPEVDFTYMATDNVGMELILATTKHSASGTAGTPGAIGKLANTWVLPPTLTLQYHLMPTAKIRPYVGAGVNYTIFYSEKGAKALETALSENVNVKMKSSFGYALQAGVDVDLTDKVFLNLDVKYVDIDTKATLRSTTLTTQKVKVHLDPLIFGVGIGFKL